MKFLLGVMEIVLCVFFTAINDSALIMVGARRWKLTNLKSCLVWCLLMKVKLLISSNSISTALTKLTKIWNANDF